MKMKLVVLYAALSALMISTCATSPHNAHLSAIDHPEASPFDNMQ